MSKNENSFIYISATTQLNQCFFSFLNSQKLKHSLVKIPET